MAKISESKGRSDTNSGYARLFGNQELGQLISRVHATVIRTGNRLEHIVEEETPAALKVTLDAILQYRGRMFSGGVQVVFQPRMPRSSESPGTTEDIAVFDHQAHRAMIVELKDGDTFDTKKADGELESMEKFANWITTETGYDSTYHFCCFNQESKEAIVSGAKGRFSIEQVMTGRELCTFLGIDYDALRAKRRSDQLENVRYFLVKLLEISPIRRMIFDLLQEDEEGDRTANGQEKPSTR